MPISSFVTPKLELLVGTLLQQCGLKPPLKMHRALKARTHCIQRIMTIFVPSFSKVVVVCSQLEARNEGTHAPPMSSPRLRRLLTPPSLIQPNAAATMPRSRV